MIPVHPPGVRLCGRRAWRLACDVPPVITHLPGIRETCTGTGRPWKPKRPAARRGSRNAATRTPARGRIKHQRIAIANRLTKRKPRRDDDGRCVACFVTQQRTMRDRATPRLQPRTSAMRAGVRPADVAERAAARGGAAALALSRETQCQGARHPRVPPSARWHASSREIITHCRQTAPRSRPHARRPRTRATTRARPTTTPSVRACARDTHPHGALRRRRPRAAHVPPTNL